MKCDLDHNLPWPAGPTRHDNLCCLCRHHHRLSHQAPGWRLRRLPDGGLEWTLPSGQTLTSYPPPFGTDDQPPVQTGTTTNSASHAASTDTDDDPAPF
jgi:hypothetical protein